MALFDTSHPMLRPLWVRVVTCAAPLLWAVFEWQVTLNTTWAAIFGAVGLCLVYVLLLTYHPTEDDAPTDRPD